MRYRHSVVGQTLVDAHVLMVGRLNRQLSIVHHNTTPRDQSFAFGRPLDYRLRTSRSAALQLHQFALMVGNGLAGNVTTIGEENARLRFGLHSQFGVHLNVVGQHTATVLALVGRLHVDDAQRVLFVDGHTIVGRNSNCTLTDERCLVVPHDDVVRCNLLDANWHLISRPKSQLNISLRP